jgi:hypothetical protein
MSPDLATLMAISGLALGAVGLLSIGLYAVFGKPSSHEGKKRNQQVVHGFQLGGGVLLGMALMAALLTCSQIAFGIIDSPKLSKLSASMIALASLGLIFSMIRMWARHFAGWIGYSIWNGLLMLTSGHLLNNPAILVPRWWSASMIVLAFVTALVSMRFADGYELKWFDKAALMVWVVAFTLTAVVPNTHVFYQQVLGLLAMSVGCMALVAAWWFDRTTSQHRSHRARRRLERLVEG